MWIIVPFCISLPIDYSTSRTDNRQIRYKYLDFESDIYFPWKLAQMYLAPFVFLLKADFGAKPGSEQWWLTG